MSIFIFDEVTKSIKLFYYYHIISIIIFLLKKVKLKYLIIDSNSCKFLVKVSLRFKSVLRL